MLFVHVNWWVIIGCAVLFQLVGMLWYSQAMFGKKWLELMGVTPEKIQDGKKEKTKMVKQYGINFVSALVMVYLMAIFVAYSVVATVSGGLLIGLLLWLGFVATTNSLEYVWNMNNKPWKLYAINTGYYLIVMLLTGVILSLWS